MDILSHTSTGIAFGTVAAAYAPVSFKKRLSILLIGAIGGALPDIDALSLWSKFDTTLKPLFNIKHSGADIYFGKLWYSHHAAMHSMLMGLFLTALLFAGHWIRRKPAILFTYKWHLIAFYGGFLFHLLEDMPTPYAVWGGVRLFWPLDNYVGGFGKIWWWNNYDLFLIIWVVIAINLIVLLLKSIRWLKHSTSMVFVVGVMVFLFQINTRKVNYQYKNHTNSFKQFEQQSKQEQERILGKKLYRIMERLDQKIPLNF